MPPPLLTEHFSDAAIDPSPRSLPGTIGDEPFCFMQSTDGRIIDLGKLCGSRLGGSASVPASGFSYSSNGYRISRFRRNCDAVHCVGR